MTRMDLIGVRSDLSEATVWLAVICSWLSPYTWFDDTLIAIGVGFVCHTIAKWAEDRRANDG